MTKIGNKVYTGKPNEFQKLAQKSVMGINTPIIEFSKVTFFFLTDLSLDTNPQTLSIGQLQRRCLILKFNFFLLKYDVLKLKNLTTRQHIIICSYEQLSL
jgi:hypothetical protein